MRKWVLPEQGIRMSRLLRLLWLPLLLTAHIALAQARALSSRALDLGVAGPANEGYMLIGAGIPTLPGFGAEGGNAHAPDEWLSEENFEKGMRAVATLWDELGNNRG